MKEYECEGCNFSQAQTYETENVVVENKGQSAAEVPNPMWKKASWMIFWKM